MADTLPEDAAALKAMLLAERASHAAEAERLKQIIRELQRHRFGKRAESLPIDQLELGLEDVQQAEAAIRGSPADERQAARQVRSRPLIEALEPWLRAKLETVSQKTKLAEAIRYALSRWEGLGRFLHDGRVEIDNNTVERAIRPIALNRKNALFAGSDGGGEHWAVLASLVETCKLNGVEPGAYLADVLTRLVNGHPQSQLDELLP